MAPPILIKSASEIIDVLGGPAALAAALGRPGRTQMVSHWKRRGIAYRWRPRVKLLLESAGYTVPEGWETIPI